MTSNHHSPSHLIFKFSVLFAIPFMLAFAILTTFQPTPAEAAVSCTDSSWSVGTEADFNSAITCFNAKTSSGDYTILLTQNISLTASLTAISNIVTDTQLIIEGNSFVVDGQDNNNVRVFNIANDTTVTIENITLTGGNHTAGGGIFNSGILTINQSNINDNYGSDHGSAIMNINDGIVTINGSVISNNTGAGDAMIAHFGKMMTITTSTISESGGSIAGIETNSNLIINNSTISSNSSRGINSSGMVTITNGTIANNRIAGVHNSGTLNMNNSIVANTQSGSDCFGTIISNGYNLDSDGSCSLSSTGDISNTNPLLSPLQDNGGTTFTHALLNGSPAINAGNTALTEDQRGMARPQFGVSDIGAYERDTLACAHHPWSITTESELNTAIDCFNSETVAGTYTLSLTENISLTANTTTISNTDSAIELLINGNNLIVDGEETYRPFTIAPTTTVTVQDITIQAGDGGGIYSEGVLTVDSSTLKDITSGSAIYSAGALTLTNSTLNNNQAEFGGGVYIYAGTVTIINSTLSGNSATSMGGAIFNDGLLVKIQNSTIVSNSANTAGGGILSTASSMTMDNSIVANNTSNNCTGTVNSNGYNFDSDGSCSLFDTGDISFQDPMLGPLQDNGGETFTHALLSHSPAINAGNSTLSEDQRGVARPSLGGDDMGAYEYVAICDAGAWAVGDEGALNNAILCFNTSSAAGSYTISLTQNISLTGSTQPINNAVAGIDLIIEGNNFTVDGQNLPDVRPVYIMADTIVTVQNITLTRGYAAGRGYGGGGILSFGTLTITHSTITENRSIFAGGGGGIESYGPLTIENSVISQNSSDIGAGIYHDAPAGLLSISNSTIKDNNAVVFGGGIALSNSVAQISHSTISSNTTAAGDGGGIYIGSGTLTVTNSTVSGNTSAFKGGGIYNAGTATIMNSTFSDNGATNGGGAIHQENSGTISLSNSIIANSSSGNNCSGTITVNAYNLDSDGSCNLVNYFDISNQDPRLGPLQDNGGATFTHALLEGSPAINAGYSTLTEDQRGFDRPRAGLPDMGAFEYVPVCSADPWEASDEATLTHAILCFSTASAAGSYTISLTQNISLTVSTQPMSNPISGIELTLEGNGFTVDGQKLADVRPFHIMADTIVTMNHITVTGGNASPSKVKGGGILSYGTLTITNSTITDNRSTFTGGGIESYGPLTIENSVISNNSTDVGAGIYLNSSAGLVSISNSTIKDNNAVVFGGGISISGGIVQISHSTINSNTAAFDAGGGIYNGGGTLTVTNSTVSANTSGTTGGGIINSGTVTIMSSTFSNNGATNSGGSIFNQSGKSLSLSNSIIANSSSGNNCAGTITSDGYNLDSDGSCSFASTGDISNQEPLLGPLQDNGGDTFTHALLDDSPAINAGDTALAEDQRGISRPQFGIADIGAFEYESECAAQPWSVATEDALNEAIVCFNYQGAADTYTISLANHITLTASTTPINNSRSNISLAIKGNRFTLNGQNISAIRPLEIITGTVATVDNIMITQGNTDSDFGGGILNWGDLTLTNSAIHNNSAERGGGIANYGLLNIAETSISENSATEDGGGLINLGTSLRITSSSIYSNTAVVFGGGIASNSPLTITQSTIFQNTANSGGGMYTGDSAFFTNSTLSGNTASVSGGAIYMTGTLTIDSSTLSGNSANSGGAFFGVGTINIQNTLIDAGGTGTNCFATVTITSNGHNLDSDGSCHLAGSGDISNQDPLLGPLQGNGGDTFTHALLEDSPAVNAGNTALAQDQRGTVRPQGDADDIGAFELVLTEPTDPTDPIDPQVEPPLGSTVETKRPSFKWDDAFDENSAVVSYTLTITQTDVVRTVEATVYKFETTGTSLTVNVDLSTGSYLWSVQARDVAGDVVAQTAEFDFVLDVDESEPTEPAVQRVYLPIMARP